MLVIRREQVDRLEQLERIHFAEELLSHLKKFSPRHCAVIGDDGAREVIRLGVTRAKKYGFTNRGPVQFYIELMFMFGSDFDTDPQFPWASESLNDPIVVDQMHRADQLHDKMLQYLQQVAGPNNEFALSALRETHRIGTQGMTFSADNFRSQILLMMKNVYSQKCDYLGDTLLKALIERGAELAKDYSVSTTSGTALFSILVFSLGHGFSADPLFPWVSKTLNDPAVPEPDKRAERLQTKALLYLDRALSHLEQR